MFTNIMKIINDYWELKLLNIMKYVSETLSQWWVWKQQHSFSRRIKKCFNLNHTKLTYLSATIWHHYHLYSENLQDNTGIIARWWHRNKVRIMGRDFKKFWEEQVKL